jgi:capsular exopolysaccharide synthesis family protein
MSRNYDVLRQLEGNGNYTDAATAPSCNPGDLSSLAVASEVTYKINSDALKPEISKLVQKTFLHAESEAVRAIVFAPVEHVRSHWLTSRVGEVLANQDMGTVCVVDANLHEPSVHQYFGIENGAGLTTALQNDSSVESFARRLPHCNLAVVTAGEYVPNWSSLLASEMMVSRVGELRRFFDFVLIEGPPLKNFGSSLLLAHLVDGIILMVEANSTRRELVQQVRTELENSNVRILGAVLNNRKFPIPEALYSRL